LIEKHYVIEEADPVVFYGAGNANLRLIRALHPKLRIIGRDNILKVMGDEVEMVAFEETFQALIEHCVKFNTLTEENIIDITRGETTKNEIAEDVIVYSTGGRPITARSENQRKLVENFSKNDLLFAIGPAGSGKTYTAIALAVRALKNKSIRKIILSRPAVEAGEKLGFLPGDMKEKIDPYLQPLYPLAFMRGRTLNDAIVILDEAQNTTTAQIKMFLTRMGKDTKMIVTGDLTQIDLPLSQKSGLKEAQRILKGIPGIAFIELTKKDIVRHKLVTRIVEAYESDEKEQKIKREVKSQSASSLTPKS